MIRTHKLPLAIALALGSSAAHALGLGAIEVRSGLNEPLVAEIPLNEAFPGEAAEVKVALAKAEDFARVGLDPSSLAVPLAFDLVDGGAGGPLIQVTSEIPVREPFLSFLVEVTWPNGRLLREYSVLLDPPGVAPAVIGTRTVVEPLREAAPAEAAPAPEALPESTVVPSEPAVEPAAPVEPAAVEAAPPEPAPAEPAPAPEPAAEPAPEPAPESAPQPEPAPAPLAAAPSEYGPVASGETLWEIASATRPSDAVTLNQMMVAILRMNPDAFGDGNANQLKRGAVLRIPTVDEAQAVAIADAAAEIAAQNQAWQAGRGTTLVADAAFGSGRPTTTDGGADSRLELVPPRSGDGDAGGVDRPGVAGGTDAALEADLKRSREQLASREQESGELRSRVAELERIQRDNERLVTLKNSEIADLQRRLEEAEQAAAAARQAAVDAETQAAAAAQAEPSPSPAAEPSPVAVEPAPVESPVAAEPVAVEPVEPPAETPTDTALPAGDTLAADAGATPAGSPVETPAETPTDSPVAAEVTPLPEPSPVSEAPPAVIEEDRPPMPWWRETWVMAAGGGAIVLLGLLLLLTRGRKKPEPVAESRSSVADSFGSGVFGAGGAAAADALADDGEGALLDRLAADPTDLEAHLELLRHHYASGDTDKFEAAAGAMYAQVVDPSVPQWQDALAMGRALLPDHPLFADLSEAPAAAGAPSAYADSAFDFDAVESAAATAAPAQVDSERDFDFSLEAPESPKATDFSFDVEVAKPDESAFRTQEIERPNFDFGLPAAAPPAVAAAPEPAFTPAPAPAAADGGFFEGEDTVGTKLDLARAYLDMGDPEGARSMLQEVISEGDEAQKAEARRLLAEIG
jgi:pilus assembly protein FimV